MVSSFVPWCPFHAASALRSAHVAVAVATGSARGVPGGRLFWDGIGGPGRRPQRVEHSSPTSGTAVDDRTEDVVHVDAPGHVGRFRFPTDGGRWWWSDGMFEIHGMSPGEVVPTLEVVLHHALPQHRAALATAL